MKFCIIRPVDKDWYGVSGLFEFEGEDWNCTGRKIFMEKYPAFRVGSEIIYGSRANELGKQIEADYTENGGSRHIGFNFDKVEKLKEFLEKENIYYKVLSNY